MKLETPYLGLKLRNPIVVGAAPFCDSVESAARLQDAGAAAVVMRSLFEEQIDMELRALTNSVEMPAESIPRRRRTFPPSGITAHARPVH